MLERARTLIDEDTTIDFPAVTSQAFPDKYRAFLLRLADASPRSAVLEAWRQVEIAASEAVRRQHLDNGISRPPVVVGKTLLEAGLIDDAEFQVFSILRSLRNRAAHETSFELAQDEAIEYAIMAQRLAHALESRPRTIGEDK